MLVADPKKQILYIEVVDSLGFANMTIGTGEVVVHLTFFMLFNVLCIHSIL